MRSKPKISNSLPEALKAGVESLSGVQAENIKVHYNSEKPSQLETIAENTNATKDAWQVLQQKQGRNNGK